MSVSRRRFLKQTFGFSAAAMLLGDQRYAFAGEAPVAEAPAGPAQHYLAVGDFGVMQPILPQQQAVATSMIQYVKKLGLSPEAMFMLGDNFYGGLGGKGVHSLRWAMNVEAMYPAETFPGPMYAMLGNHDYNDEPGKVVVDAELAYRQANPNSRWTMPAKWYRLELPAQNPLATILVLDTNFSYHVEQMVGHAERAEQLRWLTQELKKPRSTPWLFVFGHHPVFSTGEHGDTHDLVSTVEPLLDEHKVDLYLGGHDHDLQHLEMAGHPTSFVVSGGGGARARDGSLGDRGPFANYVHGFSHMELRPDTFVIRHIDTRGKQLHAFSKTLAGTVTTIG